MPDTATAPTVTRSAACQWLTSCYRHHGQQLELTDGTARCVDTLTAISAIYNLQVLGGQITPDTVQVTPRFVSVLYTGDLCSYDNDSLTRLTLAAHQQAVRVQIGVWHPDNDIERAVRLCVAGTVAHLTEHGCFETDDDRDAAVAAAVADIEAAEYDIARHGTVNLSCIELVLHPRDPAGTHRFDRHPTLADLGDLVRMVTPS